MLFTTSKTLKCDYSLIHNGFTYQLLGTCARLLRKKKQTKKCSSFSKFEEVTFLIKQTVCKCVRICFSTRHPSRRKLKRRECRLGYKKFSSVTLKKEEQLGDF